MNKQSVDHVFLDYDQARLDLNYNQSAWAPNAGEIIAWYRSASLAAHERLQCRNLAYGNGPLERIDLFAARDVNAPLVVYVHGGAWRSLNRMDSAFAAEAFVAAGVNFAVLDFASIPDARLPDMVGQVQRGIGWLARNGGEFGYDVGRLVVVGHSSGAHLVAAALSAATDNQIAPGTVSGAVCASGAYDLEGAMLSARGAYLQLSSAEVDKFSPVRHVERIGCPMIVACGDGETDEYRRHAKALHAGLIEAGKASQFILAGGQNHFEFSRTLADQDGILFRAGLDLAFNGIC
ncbi:alpha/beta hydrolase [Aminobacter sp. HY435]|uniref:alpha/beta hydrolase n=1 Tax=Aminobacter sp. HY435 TaxID=2970917 RepID=UPI0022B95D8D|nr:alpha/beta hydrolase [Aminobacter sp. HY435]